MTTVKTSRYAPRRPILLVGALLATLCLGAALLAGPAFAAAQWAIAMSHQNAYGAAGTVDPSNGSATSFPRGSGFNTYTVTVSNTGGEATGSAGVGATLTCKPGTWTASPTFSYQWLRNGTPISGATSLAYTAVPADGGTVSQCEVTGVASGVAVVAVSSAAVISPAPSTTPPSAGTPTITGSLSVGSTLTCEPGSWSGGPTFSYQWLRNGTPIEGASSATYAVAPADGDQPIQCEISGANAGGSAVAFSSPSAIVPVPPAISVEPVISGMASGEVGDTQVCDNSTWTQGTSFAYQWLRNGTPITGATGYSYTLQAEDDNTVIQCVANGTSASPAGAASASPPVVVGSPATAAPTPPATVAAPSGSGGVGTTRTCAPGIWTGASTFIYQWYENGVPFGTASTSAESPAIPSAPGLIQCAVTGVNADASASVTVIGTSGQTAPAVPVRERISPVKPTVNGAAAVGTTLSCSNGSWNNGPTSFAYQWLRNGTPISGATSSAYTSDTSDAASFLQCQVTATNSGGSESWITNQVVIASPGATNAPPQAAVAVSGTAAVGGTLTCTGTARLGPGAPITRTFQWLRAGAPISGATSPTYTVTGADLGSMVQCEVIATNPGGSIALANAGSVIGVVPPSVGSPPTSSAGVSVADSLPRGLALAGELPFVSGTGWTCTVAFRATGFTCTRSDSLAAGASYPPIALHVHVGSSTANSVTNTISVSGGGAATAVANDPTVITATPRLGIESFTTAVTDASADPYSQAGGHPFAASTSLLFSSVVTDAGQVAPAEDPRDVEIDLPPGFIGNPRALPQCPLALVSVGCPADAVAGFIKVSFATTPGSPVTFSAGDIVPVWNLAPAPGNPAEFGFNLFGGQPFVLAAHLRSDGDYGINLGDVFTDTPPPLAIDATFCADGITGTGTSTACAPVAAGSTALLTNPTKCSGAAPLTTARVSSWQEPSEYASMTSYAGAPSAPPAEPGGPISEATPVGSPGVPGGSYVTGCGPLSTAWTATTAPSLTLQPETTMADTPSGYSVDLHVPQPGLLEPEGLATADLDDTTVTLPAGVALNPSAADGLQACSETQMGLTSESPLHFNLEEPACPQAAKVGTLEIKTPLLENPLDGSVYLAKQDANPFHSRFAIYLAVDDPTTGIVLKLAGKVSPDPVTGQLTASFTENPQLPFEDFKLSFFGGPRASLVNPGTCGEYTTTTRLTPWSAADPASPTAAETATPSDHFAITSGPGGGACASTPQSRPFAPALSAGTESSAAGAHSPFTLKLTRNDGEQEFGSIDTTLPPGVTASLAGVPYCADASIPGAAGKSGTSEIASPSCPSASQIGTLTTGAGAGSNPYYVTGKAYLAGPYKGAPLSVAFITPAVAGPFDLGNVVVRAGLYVNPETAQVTVKTDPIPQILEGVPLQIRSIVAKIDRPNFTLNPTSCEPMSVATSIAGSSGATASPSNRFQVGGCANLPFKPNLKIQLKGATGRTGHPALKAVVTTKPGEADIGRAQVNLPHSEFLDQNNLNNTCTKPVLLAGNCPKSSIYGKAKAWTPLLEKPLEGNVYLVGGYGYKLPALVADLNGQIRVTLVGKVDSGPNHGIRNTFEVVPDAPVSRFELSMKGGKKYGLLVNSEPLCEISKAKRQAIVRFTGQNNKVKAFKPVVANQCKKHSKRKHHKKAKGHGQGKAKGHQKQTSLERALGKAW